MFNVINLIILSRKPLLLRCKSIKKRIFNWEQSKQNTQSSTAYQKYKRDIFDPRKDLWAEKAQILRFSL